VKVPLLDLKAHHEPIEAELFEAMTRVLRSQQFILGPEVEAFERRVAAACGVPHAIGMSSGTDALLAALMALGIGPGDEVVTTDYSFFATAGVIARLGARPVLVDIDPATFNIDAAGVEAAITPRTRAILPVHLFGQPADMVRLLDIAVHRRIALVEDAAQAIGAVDHEGRRVGSLATMATFSFFPSKNLGALGDAGMVVTADTSLAARLRTLRNHGASPKYHHDVIGGNFRLDALQAAVLGVKLSYLDGWTKRRQDNARRYVALFEQSGLPARGLVTLPVAPGADPTSAHRHIFNQFVVRATRRDVLRAFLAERGVGTEVYYPVPFHLQPCFRFLGHREGDFPQSERAARETLALPIYPELTAAQQEYVVARIADFYATAGSA